MKNKQNAKSHAQKKAVAAAEAFVRKSSFKSDPLGSYTGRAKDKREKPVQDADDL